MDWRVKSLGSVAFFVAGMLALRAAGRTGAAPNLVMSLTVGVAAAACVAASPGWRASVSSLGRREALLLVAFGLAFFAGNALYFQGVVEAPNPGYARGLMAAEVVALAVIAWVVGDPLSARGALGVGLVSAGIALSATG